MAGSNVITASDITSNVHKVANAVGGKATEGGVSDGQMIRVVFSELKGLISEGRGLLDTFKSIQESRKPQQNTVANEGTKQPPSFTSDAERTIIKEISKPHDAEQIKKLLIDFLTIEGTQLPENFKKMTLSEITGENFNNLQIEYDHPDFGKIEMTGEQLIGHVARSLATTLDKMQKG